MFQEWLLSYLPRPCEIRKTLWKTSHQCNFFRRPKCMSLLASSLSEHIQLLASTSRGTVSWFPSCDFVSMVVLG
jgi:hypothetical protein